MKYRKKPVVIEAIKFNGFNQDSFSERPKWIEEAVINGTLTTNLLNDDLVISTLEGEIYASVGDYIIRGINGELYPCKPDIFEKTYEVVKDD